MDFGIEIHMDMYMNADVEMGTNNEYELLIYCRYKEVVSEVFLA